MRRRDEGMYRWFASKGYAGVRVDMRGSGESDGILEDEYLKKEPDDRFAEDVHYSGGCLLNDNFWWGCVMQVFNARPPDPQIVGERWRQMWLERLQAERFWPETWLAHQALDVYWKHGSIAFDYRAITCPVWLWGGWADAYRDTPFRLAANLRVPHKVTVGPWAHQYPHESTPIPAVGFLQEAQRWWDHWLAGQENDLMKEPAFQFYMLEGAPPRTSYAERPGHWVGLREWPSADTELLELVLNTEGRLGREALTEEALTIASPQSTGLAAGDWGSFAVAGDMPGDQRLDSFGSLEFDSQPLDSSVQLLGNACVALDLAADRPNAFVAVRLIDVGPDNASWLSGDVLRLKTGARRIQGRAHVIVVSRIASRLPSFGHDRLVPFDKHGISPSPGGKGNRGELSGAHRQGVEVVTLSVVGLDRSMSKGSCAACSRVNQLPASCSRVFCVLDARSSPQAPGRALEPGV